MGASREFACQHPFMGALAALSQNIDGRIFYVHEPEDTSKLKIISNKEVRKYVSDAFFNRRNIGS